MRSSRWIEFRVYYFGDSMADQRLGSSLWTDDLARSRACFYHLLISACSGGGGGNGDPPGGTNSEPSNNSDPSTVVAKLALDEDSPSDSVLATLPDGAKIDLYFPQYSIRSAVEVQVAALPAIKLPTGTVAGGVRLLPEGTVLRNPATLTLKVPGTLEQARTMGFAIHNGVVTYHPVFLRHEGSSTVVDIPLNGFSDHGLVSDADPGVVADALLVTTPPLDRLSARLATANNAASARELLTDFFNTEVKPALEFTTTDPADRIGLEVAMRLFIAWRNLFNIMVSRYPEVDDLGTTEDFSNALLKDAISANMTYWNQQCETSLEPADGMRVVQAWMWAPVVYLDHMEGLRKSDLLDMLCIKMEILSADLDAILNAELTKPLILRTGLKIRTDNAHHFEPRGLVRVQAVQGGSVTPTADQTDNAGQATLNVTPQSDTPGVAAVINVSAKGSGGIVGHEYRLFRPIEGKQDKLLTGKNFTGTVKEYFVYAPYANCPTSPPGDLACAATATGCLTGGTTTHLGGRIIIAGDPLAYDIDYIDSGYEPPAGDPSPSPMIWRYKGSGTFSVVYSSQGFSYTRDDVTTYATDSIYTSHIAARNLSLSVHSETGNLTGEINYQCHRVELEMQPAPPP